MSHFVSIETEIRDIDALRRACKELRVELLENDKARGYASRTMKADYVIRLKGPYDVALNRGENGTYKLSTDWWRGHVEKQVGKNYGRLLQLYVVHKTRAEAHRKGHTCSRHRLNDGSIRLSIGGVM